MKKLLLLLTYLIISIVALAESVSPTYGVKFERRADVAIIEGKLYNNVIVEINAADINDIFKDGVKVTIKDAINPKKKLYKKRFSKSSLYGFSDGTIQIGKGNVLTQLVLFKKNGERRLLIREKGID